MSREIPFQVHLLSQNDGAHDSNNNHAQGTESCFENGPLNVIGLS